MRVCAEIYRLISKKTMGNDGANGGASIPQGQKIAVSSNNANKNANKSAGGCC